MAWNLAKKLRDTHLGPFSTSSTTDSRKDDAESADANTIGITRSKPDILVVTLHEARGLSLPEKYRGDSTPSRGFAGFPTVHGRVSPRYMPYALVDFDKVQVFINSVGGTPEDPLWAGSNTHYKFDVSRVANLTIHLFVRNPHAAPGSGRAQDICLGVVHVDPQLHAKEPSKSHRGVGWVDVQQGTGKLQVGVEYHQEDQARKLTINDFELLKIVGEGSFGRVIQVRKKDTNRIYALKTIRKAKIISRSEVTHTLAERSVLAQISNPFIVPLKFSFQSPDKLYFVLAFVNGGELFYHLSQQGRFDINRARFYTAELLCALECLHGFNVIYRDLKPENILLDFQGHIALCDFGLCKLEMKDDDRTRTFCGTPEYIAPELLLRKGYNKTIDWWTLGVLLFEMLTGLPPFYDEVTDEMYQRILYDDLRFPGDEVIPPTARDLISKLLNRDPAERLGANGPAEIKSHPFFHDIDWRRLLDRRYEPAFKPSVANALDTSSIDEGFTSRHPEDSPVNGAAISESQQKQFVGFSYNRPVAGLNDAGGSILDSSFIQDAEHK